MIGGDSRSARGGAGNGLEVRPAKEARWRRDQRSRRSRRLTSRGRATLATAGFAAGLAAVWALDPSAAVGSEPLLALNAAAVPAVSAPPPGPPRAPDALLGRLPITEAALELPVTGEAADSPDGSRAGHLFERVELSSGTHTVEYTLDAELTRQVFRTLSGARVALGNAIVIEPEQGRVLAYVSTDTQRFPPTRSYPAASLVKVITAAAALDLAPDSARLPCRYRGSPYRLTESRLEPPAEGKEVSLRKALATSNNQCFAQLAVHVVGANPLIQAITRFGWLSAPAPGHAPGEADPGEDRLDVGRLGCGLDGCRITPLHAAQLAASLAHGELVPPRWVERVWDGHGRELAVPPTGTRRRVLSPGITSELRSMLVETTRKGTARRAFRDRRGGPLLGSISVAGKTGSLSGQNPDGRYEWFVGVAPADAPRVAVATVLVQGDLYWRTSSQVAADVLRRIFCDKDGCAPEYAERFTGSALPEPRAPKETYALAASGQSGQSER